MNLSRRTFTKLLGFAPASGAVAMKAAGDVEIAKLVGISSGAGAFEQTGGGQGPVVYADNDSYTKTRIAASEYVKHIGVPEFVKDQYRRQSQYVSLLDPDLAAKKSWSMSVKILTQRERNFQRMIEGIHNGALSAQGSSVFKKLTGWEWPW